MSKCEISQSLKESYMSKLKGTQTEQNLLSAFSGESQARNKYTYFAKQAKEDGYIEISQIFEETANNEKEHAKIWFKLLKGIKSTEENLKAAADTELFENSSMYPDFAKTAKDEGFDDIAELFEQVAEIEKMHETRYRKLLSELKEETIFCANEETVWECAKCGHREIGKEAPKCCPVCKHPQAYFINKSECL